MDARLKTSLAERVRFHSLLIPSPNVKSTDPSTQFFRTGKEPGVLVELDAVYNITRHAYAGLAVERSPGFFDVLDMEGDSTPYVCWRRTEAHAYFPEALSLDWETVDLQSMDGQRRPLVPNFDLFVEGENLFTNRLHPFGSWDVRDWIPHMRRYCFQGVDLAISLRPEDTSPETVFTALKELLKQGGDAVVPWSTWTAPAFKKQREALGFRRVDRFRDVAVCLDKQSRFEIEQGFDQVERAVYRHLEEPTYDGLRRWIACRV